MADRPEWRIAQAVVKGSSHEQAGTECQDFGGNRVLSLSNEPILLLFVSDGAGSATRSGEGAAIACHHFVNYFEKYFREGGCIDEITESACTDWAVNAREALREAAILAEAKLQDFACTFLGAILSESGARFLQIGDGAIVCSNEKDKYTWVFWPEKAEYANVTYFLTQDDAAKHIQYSEANEELPEVALFSDGLERLALQMATKTVHDPFFHFLFSQLRKTEPGPSESVGNALKELLNSAQVLSRTDDDKTIVLATRLGAVEPTVESAYVNHSLSGN